MSSVRGLPKRGVSRLLPCTCQRHLTSLLIDEEARNTSCVVPRELRPGAPPADRLDSEPFEDCGC